MEFTTRYSVLNKAQKEAVEAIDGPVMVIAGPGTGKTELLSMRAANILKKTDTLPQNILCLTFTESGANAMRERLLQIIGAAAYKVPIHTFHSFGTEIMGQNSQYFYHGSDFHPADELTSYQVLESIFDELEYNNPLAAKLNGEYTYLRDTQNTISELKKSGLTSDELLAILDANELVIEAVEAKLAAVFANRLTKMTIQQLTPVIETILQADGKIEIPGIVPLSRVMVDSLEAAIAEATDQNSTKAITAWRNLWMRKDEAGNFVLKAKQSAVKLRAVSFIYYQYLLRMQEAKMFDFDDMILRVVHAMEVYPELRFNLQEQYQYIMVDEFQDTNLAQMRILYNLTESETNQGRPDILVVGDDDQAIYSFQGADVGNINAFLEIFPTTKQIVLTDNYRSSKAVLSHSRSVITLGSTRLENVFPELNKTLTPHYAPKISSVELYELPTADDERAWLAHSIARRIKEGVEPRSIAILARRHRELEALLPFLSEENIPVSYEKQFNVLDLEPIKLLEHTARILVALFEQRHDDADSLLPELLAHPAFAIPPLQLWRLSLNAQESHKSWLEVMSVTPDFMPLHEWLVTSSQALATTPLERMVDHIIGRTNEEVSYTSPIYNYYFSKEKLAHNPEEYLSYLDGLRTIRSRLSEYHPDENPTLQVFLEFVRLHRELGSNIMNTRSRETKKNAIQLMTAHKSKGLEFEHVYITGAVDSAWGERVRSRSRLISYPQNLPLAVAGDTYDERLRLFFVAMTRAKSNLSISYSLVNDGGKETLRASFLSEEPWGVNHPEITKDAPYEIKTAEIAWYQPLISPISPSQKEALAPRLENYKLSATHVNAFLDITHDGPQGFLINELLRFPQAKHASACYGSAIHLALQHAHSHLAATGKQRPHEDILHDFEEALREQHLSEKDFHDYLQKGSSVLSTFLDAKYDSFSPTQKAELNFASQSVFIGAAQLTGKLDLVDISEGTITITDYKTGRAARTWQGKDEYEKIKLHKYRQQLMFYNLLTTHSRDYAKYSVKQAILQFVEPTPQNEIVALEAQFSSDDLKQFSQLVEIIWEHIKAFDLPDTSSYSSDLKGMLAFENDLLDKKI
jgi:DNA helicase-2/ATP-dependent DNA helicase PcrA